MCPQRLTENETCVGSIHVEVRNYFHLLALVAKRSAALNVVTRHGMFRKLDRKRVAECLSNKFSGYPVICGKMIYLIKNIIIIILR